MNDRPQSVVAARSPGAPGEAGPPTQLLPSFVPLAYLSPAERSGLIDRVYNEFCDLREAGVAVDPDEYCDRFPGMQTSLRRLIDVDRQINENPATYRGLAVRWPEAGDSFFGYYLLQELG